MKIIDMLHYELYFGKITRKKCINGSLDPYRGTPLLLLSKIAFMLVLALDVKR
jgi:hypothetical protein